MTPSLGRLTFLRADLDAQFFQRDQRGPSARRSITLPSVNGALIDAEASPKSRLAFVEPRAHFLDFDRLNHIRMYA